MSTSEDAKKSVSQSSSKKEESKNLSTKKDNILYNPELLSKRKVIINTSTSKEMYSFSTAKRFQKSTRDDSPFFYNIPTSISHRGTSIGYGSKISFSSKNQSPGPGAYNYLKINLKGRYAKSDFPNSPQSKFGSSIRFKKEKVFSDTPAPNTYYLESMIKGNGIIYNSRYNSNPGKTMGQKLGTIGQSIVSPGPGSYDYMKLNLKGKYPSSLISNSVLNTFGNEIRFKKKKNEDNPAPNAYKLEDMIKGNGVVYNSRYNSNLGKSIGQRFNTTLKENTPGPGAYEFFSDFEGFYKYGKNKKYSDMKEEGKDTTNKNSENKEKSESN